MEVVALTELGRRCTDMEELDLARCDRVTDAVLKSLYGCATERQPTRACACTAAWDHALMRATRGCAPCSMRRLRRLNLSLCPLVTEAAVRDIRVCLPSLQLVRCVPQAARR